MGYVYQNEFDRHQAQVAKANEQMNDVMDQRRALIVDRDVRLRGMFGDERLAHADELVRVEINRARGYVSPHTLAEEQAKVRQALQPILAESPEMPLNTFREIVAGLTRPKLSDVQVEQRRELLTSLRTPVYETKHSRVALLEAATASIAAEKPLLSQVLQTTGAGSIALARAAMAQEEQRAHAGQQRAVSAKPFASLPAPARAAPPAGKLWPYVPPKGNGR